MADTTTIEIKTGTWKQLNQRKEPGDSFDDVISRLLEETAS
jgi:predicted CopG family antitoxin